MPRAIRNEVRLRDSQSGSAARVAGTAERPRLAVYRSVSAHIYAQVIDDRAGHTMVVGFVERQGRLLRTAATSPAQRKSAALVAERAKEKGITRVVFDRGGYLYHGRVKALADAAREAGLEF